MVLDGEFVDLHRSTRIPALSRLSHTWTLQYSLDQHGILLSTLHPLRTARPCVRQSEGLVDGDEGRGRPSIWRVVGRGCAGQ